MNNNLRYCLGGVFLALAKVKQDLLGYKSKPNKEGDDIDYGIRVVKDWELYLKIYTKRKKVFKNNTILELGPGNTLTTAFILLNNGAKRYIGADAKKLFDEELLQGLEFIYPNKVRFEANEDFDLTKLKGENIDLIVSQSAFEHFSDVRKTIKQLTDISKSGTILIAQIDLKTHSRYIRQKDPYNIYRYNDKIYNKFTYYGKPNRVTEEEYEQTLTDNEWGNIKIYRQSTPNKEYIENIKLDNKFKGKLYSLSIVICATKK